MIRLATVIETFEASFLAQYGDSLLPSQGQALSAMKTCRTSASPLMQATCSECDHHALVTHSCGHRACPHCQHHESQQWLARQIQKQVSAEYFLLTFTLPVELRPLAWRHQRTVYDRMSRCSWETVRTFARNDPQLNGRAGAITVLHTHSRRLDYHPHVHLVMPAAAIDPEKRLWRTKKGNKGRGAYLFSHKALAKVFRAKLLDALTRAGLALPPGCPENWVVDVTSVGNGEKALVYLGRYLYRGVISERDILACENGQVTFRYRNAKTRRLERRMLPGEKFLALILRHVLPKGLRRARNFGFLHPNSKRLIALLQSLTGFNPKPALAAITLRPTLICPCCGAVMEIVKTRIARRFDRLLPIPIPQGREAAVM